MATARKTTPARRSSRHDRTARVTSSVEAFRRILRELRVAARQTEQATGLSAAQMFVLSAVAALPGCSVNDIAEATMTDRSSAAAIVDRLVEDGHLKRTQAEEDRRRASITLTARGRRATGKGTPAPAALLVQGLQRLSPAELTALSRGLSALTREMGIAGKPVGMFFEDEKQR